MNWEKIESIKSTRKYSKGGAVVLCYPGRRHIRLRSDIMKDFLGDSPECDVEIYISDDHVKIRRKNGAMYKCKKNNTGAAAFIMCDTRSILKEDNTSVEMECEIAEDGGIVMRRKSGNPGKPDLDF